MLRFFITLYAQFLAIIKCHIRIISQTICFVKTIPRRYYICIFLHIAPLIHIKNKNIKEKTVHSRV